MKIGIDISSLIYETGVSTYTKNLVDSLLAIDKQNKYILFGGSLRRLSELKEKAANLKGSCQMKLFYYPPLIADLVWNRLHILPVEVFTGKVDIFHTSDWSQPPSKAPKVSTVHDLTPILYPRLTNSKVIATHKRALKWMKKEVRTVIAPSKATKSDLVALGFNEKNIAVIPEAVDERFKPASKEDIQILKDKLKIKSDYLLAVGVGPRKNTKKIIRAFELAKSGRNLKLLIVGYDHFGYSEVRGVRFLGHMNVNELISLYSGAKALVYPSIHEGFGLPILEAFSCKCPVVTSNCSSMPEVAGDAAILVDPKDERSIAEGINSAFKVRQKLISKGTKRAREFSWEKTAKLTLDVYRQVLNK